MTFDFFFGGVVFVLLFVFERVFFLSLFIYFFCSRRHICFYEGKVYLYWTLNFAAVHSLSTPISEHFFILYFPLLSFRKTSFSQRGAGVYLNMNAICLRYSGCRLWPLGLSPCLGVVCQILRGKKWIKYFYRSVLFWNVLKHWHSFFLKNVAFRVTLVCIFLYI